MFNFYPPYTSTSINHQVSLIWVINDLVGARKIFVSSADPKSVDFYILSFIPQFVPNMHSIDRKDHSVNVTFLKVTFYCVNFDYEILATVRREESPKISLHVEKPRWFWSRWFLSLFDVCFFSLATRKGNDEIRTPFCFICSRYQADVSDEWKERVHTRNTPYTTDNHPNNTKPSSTIYYLCSSKFNVLLRFTVVFYPFVTGFSIFNIFFSIFLICLKDMHCWSSMKCEER